MEYCVRCFKRLCRCGSYKVDIDYYIYPAIYELNRKGYYTSNCCSGHIDDYLHLSTYIKFCRELDEPISSDYFQYESYNYRGFHEKRDCIRAKPEIIKKFKKKRTNHLQLVQEINKDLYIWAKNLPPIEPVKAAEIEFPESYFEQEVEDDAVVDVQKPWLLFARPAHGNRQTLIDFFEEFDHADNLTEVVVSRLGNINRFSEQVRSNGRSKIHSDTANTLKKRIAFDIVGDYKYLCFGYEQYLTVEKLLLGESVWHLSYARVDIPITYGETGNQFYAENSYAEADLDEDFEDFEDFEDYDDNSSCKHTACGNSTPGGSGMENLFDEDDIEDFMDEFPNVNEIELFRHLFNRLCRIENNLVWANKKRGVMYLKDSTYAYETLLVGISGNVNEDSKVTDQKGLLSLLAESKNVCSLDDGEKYWICANGQAYIWDYSLQGYTSDTEKLCWFYADGINVLSWAQGEKHIYGLRSEKDGSWLFEQTDDYMDYNQPFVKVMRLQGQTFGTMAVTKNVEAIVLTMDASSLVALALLSSSILISSAFFDNGNLAQPNHQIRTSTVYPW